MKWNRSTNNSIKLNHYARRLQTCLRLPMRLWNAGSLAAHVVASHPKAEAETLVLGAGATKLRRRAPPGWLRVGEQGEQVASAVQAAWAGGLSSGGRNPWGREMMLKAEKFQEKETKERYGDPLTGV